MTKIQWSLYDRDDLNYNPPLQHNMLQQWVLNTFGKSEIESFLPHVQVGKRMSRNIPTYCSLKEIQHFLLEKLERSNS